MQIISVLYYNWFDAGAVFLGPADKAVPPEKYAKITEWRYKGMAEIRSLERYYKPPGSVALRGE